MRGLISGGGCAIDQDSRGGERKRVDPSFAPGIEQQNLPSLPKQKKRCRNLNWNANETSVLIKCMKEGGQFRNRGNCMDWKAICQEIETVCGSPRTIKECQRRSDTLTKARKEVKSDCGVNYKLYFQIPEKKRSGKLSTRLTLEWYENLEQIEQQQHPGYLSSSNSGGSPSLSGTPTPSRSDLAEDAGSSGTDLISSLQSSPSPDLTQFQDAAVPYQTHSSESTELLFQQMAQGPATPDRTGIVQSSCCLPSRVSTQFKDPAVPYRTQSSESTELLFQQIAQGPATPNRPDIPQVVQAVDPQLHAGGESDAVDLDHAPCDPWTLESIGKAIQEDQDCYYERKYGWVKDVKSHAFGY